MKRILSHLICLIAFLCAFDACAQWSDKKYADRINTDTRQYVKDELSARDAKISELENKIKGLSEKIEKLDEWSHNKWEFGSKELTTTNQKINTTRTWTSVSLWLVVPLACALLAVMVFAFWPRKRVVTGASADITSRPKCPRCGWEHDPGETVCRNPTCKTHF